MYVFPALKSRVLIVAEHASAKFGGEAILPLHYFRGLRRRGIEVWLIVHSRTGAMILRRMFFAGLPSDIAEYIQASSLPHPHRAAYAARPRRWGDRIARTRSPIGT